MFAQNSSRLQNCVTGQAQTLDWSKFEFSEDQIIYDLVWVIAQFKHKSSKVITVELQEALKKYLLEDTVHSAHIVRNGTQEIPSTERISGQGTFDSVHQLLVNEKHSC